MLKEKGAMQSEMACYMDVTPQAVSQRLKTGHVSREQLPKLARFFGISLDELLNETAHNEKKILIGVKKWRRQRLINLIAEQQRLLSGTREDVKNGGQAKLAELTDSSPAHLSQIVNRTHEMGDKVARRIEEKLNMPPGAMDWPCEEPGIPDQPSELTEQEEILLGNFRHADKRGREQIHHVAEMQVEYMIPTSQSGSAKAKSAKRSWPQ
ncbi:MAG: helix-turn-helix transcriptional regulator [Gammaproteobacteria bacterium]